jgi:hypothetical protein
MSTSSRILELLGQVAENKVRIRIVNSMFNFCSSYMIVIKRPRGVFVSMAVPEFEKQKVAYFVT